ncbi:D-2-hydroxyacid dehydrogenase [Paractinoplanes rishiriensis]|uniref:D-2-hydroxyacid dehydrogenase n=1 Tax=Paractinoplanes rishiriensis TaxID=1050105 RepID=UPI0019420958|nr:D-2-hydroxyacid dehydrogenase [Actinoplanes rishiriensis]
MDGHAAALGAPRHGVALTGVRLAVLGDPPDDCLRRVERAWPEATPVDQGPAEAVLAWTYDPEPLLDLLGAGPAPAWVQTRSVGVDPRIAALLQPARTVLTTGRGAHGAAVAEHVVVLLLTLLRRVPELLRAQSERRWLDPFELRELAGCTVGVLGLGDVGEQCARLLAAFGTRVRGLRRTARGVTDDPPEFPQLSAVYGPDRLAAFLTGLDVLVVAVPLTACTRGLVGAAELGRLAPDALLVNVGRGPVVDQDALVRALCSGRLGGAALDVLDVEPLPPDSGLWTTPNLLISPHCADRTPATDERFVAGYLDRIARYRRGEPLTGFDPVTGY